MAANQQPRKTGTETQTKAIYGGGGFIAGLVAGLVIMALVGPSDGPRVSDAPAPITGGQQAGPDRIKLSRDIEQLEEILRKDPKNHQALVQLGNDYFDLGEAQKSVDAYQRALALKGDDPNVLTDMGVMYRQLKDFPKAVAAFRRAMAASPTHPQSRMNLGVVLMHDLSDKPGAIAAWEDYLRVAPNDASSENIRRALASLKSEASGASENDQAARELGSKAAPPPAPPAR
ncbi:MAG TPA: tetratricopeptide repeat protein [Candidatus Methanoperedens sp.]|nr:tetratricopeptide repeat protein [Candidatus Methanoperedens sp.]